MKHKRREPVNLEHLVKKAYAKVNLGLDVLHRRPDGYHEVKMVMQTVDLYDCLTIRRVREPGVHFSMESDCDLVPADDTNLVCRAARRLMEQCGICDGVAFSLQKNIPVAAGMAGGSADAAAVLTGMNELFKLGLSYKQLREIAVTIGADIPFCIEGGTALSEGIGEVLTPLPAPPECALVIVKPDVSVSTKHVYEELDAKAVLSHPDIDGMVAAIRQGDPDGIARRMENVLECVSVQEYPIIAEIKRRLLGENAAAALMSGSGPTVFGVFYGGGDNGMTDAGRAAAVLEQSDLRLQGRLAQIIVTNFINPGNSSTGRKTDG